MDKVNAKNTQDYEGMLDLPERKSIHEFQIGEQVGRLFDDGNYYIARIISAPKEVYDDVQGKKVWACLIRYDEDDQEEWADEEQLNKWACNETTKEASNDNCNEILHPEDSMTDDDESFLSLKNLEEDNVILCGDEGKNGGREDLGAMVTPPKAQPQSLYSQEHMQNISIPSDQSTSHSENSVPKDVTTTDDMHDTSMANTGQRKSKRTKRKTATYISEASSSISNQVLSASAATMKNKSKKNCGNVQKTKEGAKKALMFIMGIAEEEIDSVLEEMSAPYELNEAVNNIHKKRHQGPHKETESSERFCSFYPKCGTRVRIPEGGSNWHGTVIVDQPNLTRLDGEEKETETWTVKFDDDGTTHELEFQQLLKFRADRPVAKLDGCRGRTLCALELFSGEGIVSQEFCQRNFQVKSIDSNPSSYATNVIDILKLKYQDIGFVPDFIWASPPCTTYSNVTHGHHRDVAREEFAKTKEAHHANYLLVQMMCIMIWAKSKNSHLIVVIENPVGKLKEMPMMKQFEKSFGLHKTTVDYCAFESYVKKPTNIWTNDYNLSTRLSAFRCTKDKCPFFGQTHPLSVCSRGGRRHFNVAAIPQKLAEEVAHYVDAKFYINDISKTPKVILSADEENDFNLKMS